jgi:hypothetical protein
MRVLGKNRCSGARNKTRDGRAGHVSPVSPRGAEKKDRTRDDQGTVGQRNHSKSESPYVSPITLVKKKTGDYRICVDYRKMDAVMTKDKYSLPTTKSTSSEVINISRA